MILLKPGVLMELGRQLLVLARPQSLFQKTAGVLTSGTRPALRFQFGLAGGRDKGFDDSI